MNKKINLITVGSDPEFFIINEETKEFVSSEGIVGGTKDNPSPVFDDGEFKGHAVQEDNVMAEITIPPVTSALQLKREVDLVINFLNNKLAEINPNYKITIVSSASFTDEQLNTEQAQTVGCSPDYNAWLEDMNPKVEVAKTNTRWAGGHIHIGYDELSNENTLKLIKAFDMFIGLPFVIMDPNDERKKVYGSAGRFRFTPYGFEYRTLSNYWLSEEKLIEFVFSQINKAFAYVNSGQEVSQDVKKIIDTVDKFAAQEFIQKHNIYNYESKSEKSTGKEKRAAVSVFS